MAWSDAQQLFGRRTGRFLGAIAFAAVLAFAAIANPARAQTSPEGAAQFMSWLGDQAVATLSAPGYSLEQREAAVRNLLRESFDLEFIGRFVLGKYWRSASAEQRDQYQAMFSEYVVRTYSARIGGYSGETLQIVSARPSGEKDAVVQTEITRPSGPPLSADWRVRAGDGRYRIIDVTIEGVSMAVNQRSEFAAVIQNAGMNGLLSALQARTAKLSAMSG
jgi:phospholipid transport system substrate-binding protein